MGHDVLVVEDEMVNRLYLKTVVRNLGLTVREARNGKEAVEMTAADPPGVILMDLNMPVMNGIEAAREIRKDHPAGTLTILAVTAYETEEYYEASMDVGMDGFLAKPVDEVILRRHLLGEEKEEGEAAGSGT